MRACICINICADACVHACICISINARMRAHTHPARTTRTHCASRALVRIRVCACMQYAHTRIRAYACMPKYATQHARVHITHAPCVPGIPHSLALRTCTVPRCRAQLAYYFTHSHAPCVRVAHASFNHRTRAHITHASRTHHAIAVFVVRTIIQESRIALAMHVRDARCVMRDA
jgi:hypothetical protein